MTLERRLLLAIVLSLGVLVMWQMLIPHRPAPPAGMEAETPAAAEAQAEEAPLPAPSLLEDQAPVATSMGEAEARTLTIQAPESLVMLTNRGGRVMSWKLITYKDRQGRNLELVPAAAQAADRLPLELLLDDPDLQKAANSALYRMEQLDSGPTPEVVMTWSDGLGHQVRKTVTFRPQFEASVEIDVRDHGRPVPAALTWAGGFGEGTEDGLGGGFLYSGRAVLDDAPRKPLRLAKVGSASRSLVGRWGGMEDTYFTALFLPVKSGPFAVHGGELPVPGQPGEVKPVLEVTVQLPRDGTPTGLYVGPKDYELLQSKGRDLQEVVQFQSGFWVIGPVITYLSRGLFHALVFLHSRVVANWGWDIVLMTILLKLVFWPLTHRSMLSMKHMQEKTKRLQPKMAAIKERYRRQGKKDIESRNKMNQEIMALYQKEGINPMGNLGGCLPLLLNLPILYAFYNILRVAIELRQAPFVFWIHDLSSMDPHRVLPVVMGASMVAQQALTSSAIADPMQRRMMYLTPVLFTLFFLNMPAGLVLYWLVNNLLGILQQYMINRRYHLETAAGLARRTPVRRKA